MTIYLPSTGADSWRALLADPGKHWRTGYSARSIAFAWEAAPGLPPEIDALLGGGTDLLIAIPEHKVALAGGRRASQCDVFALVNRAGETIAMAVEGKVNEPFGPTIGDWGAPSSRGKTERLAAIAELLGVTAQIPGSLRYQLFHRTAAAVLEARRFKADRAAMIVHSFSPINAWFDEFGQFCEFLNCRASIGVRSTITLPNGMPLDLGWAKGDPRFLTA